MATMGTPQSEQGQTVERSYGWIRGEYYMREHDRSDRSVAWYRADRRSRQRLSMTSYDAEGAMYPPRIDAWEPCAEPADDGDD